VQNNVHKELNAVVLLMALDGKNEKKKKGKKKETNCQQTFITSVFAWLSLPPNDFKTYFKYIAIFLIIWILFDNGLVTSDP